MLIACINWNQPEIRETTSLDQEKYHRDLPSLLGCRLAWDGDVFTLRYTCTSRIVGWSQSDFENLERDSDEAKEIAGILKPKVAARRVLNQIGVAMWLANVRHLSCLLSRLWGLFNCLFTRGQFVCNAINASENWFAKNHIATHPSRRKP